MSKTDLDAAEKLAAEATCRLIIETNSGPGRGTPCGKVVVETLHGVRVCVDHSAHARRANCMDPLHIDDTVSSRLAAFPALIAECRRLTAERDEARRERDELEMIKHLEERPIRVELRTARRERDEAKAEVERQRGWIAGLDAGLCDDSIAKQTAEAIAAWLETRRKVDDAQHGRLAAHERSLAAEIRTREWKP